MRFDRQPPDLVDRLFAPLQHAEQFGSADQRHAGCCSARILPAWAATSAICAPGSARAHYWTIFNNFIFSLTGEAGYIHSFEDGTPTVDPVRLTDRFFLGSPQMRGFDIRGIGPRVQRVPYIVERDANGVPTSFTLITDPQQITDDAIGGRAYYLARAELEIPLGAAVRDLGLRPSVFVDVGAAFGVRTPALNDIDPNNALGPKPVHHGGRREHAALRFVQRR